MAIVEDNLSTASACSNRCQCSLWPGIAKRKLWGFGK